ncbi:DNA transposition protein [Mesorhizobium sp. Root157]|uniref:AAA family ATPase n=1 Tax=Mesorhizobium sp. Root157 TaxID=1736477 RepID=UPI0006F4FD3C|nr:AAA family ATPase [Mesorhizobium sp. Root157]KQZ87229.1 DNA transposition protein [Mesorhizobium sp. Root157]
MNEIVGTSHLKSTPVWERPLAGPDASLANRTETDINAWWLLIDQVIEIATAQGWTKTDVARRIGMPDGTFSQWFSGKYNGRLENQNKQVQLWLDAVGETVGLVAAIPSSPAFLPTIAAKEVLETLHWAQVASDMVIITLEAGMGKTMTCKHFAATRPHVYMVTMSPHTKTVHGMLTDLAQELDVMVHNPARLTRAIGKRLERSGDGTLLIVDEAQNLNDDAVNQLRHFVDIHRCGVALVGNTEIYGRFSKNRDDKRDGPSYAQIKRRIGKRLLRNKPYMDDLRTFISAWGVSDPDAVKFLIGVGNKGGALGQIDKTVKLASMLATGCGEPISLKHLQGAWKNRDVEMDT